MRSYQELDVWQVGMTLAEACYKITRKFPTDERFGLTTQMRRAATSIPANIAEGYGRESTGSFIQFLRISQGSTKELETHIELARRIEILGSDDATALKNECERVGKMLRNLIRSLQAKLATTTT